MGGASPTPALRVASAKAAMARACTVTSVDPPSTATCTSWPRHQAASGQARPWLSTSPGTPKTE